MGHSGKQLLAPLASIVATMLLAASCGSTSGELTTITPSEDIERAEAAVDAPVAALASGFNQAGFDLLTTQPIEDNLVFSPLSIGHALLMARGAADESTGQAIDVAFGLPTGIAAHEAWNTLDTAIDQGNRTMTAIDGEPSPIVTVAGRVWPSTTAEPDQAWIDLLATHHGADVELIDTAKPEESRAAINQWVSGQTNELIPELLPTGFIRDTTVLVLVDAVYFKAQWRSIFGKYGETVKPFTLLDGSEVETTFLVDLEQPGPRGIGDGYAAAELAYLGDEYSMLIIVPDEGRFAEIRDGLSTDMLKTIDDTMSTGPYELLMPEWETTTSIPLLPWLTEIGAAPGSYPGIGPDVFLADAIHGADITVDEIGTEAAAATALGFDESGPGEPELTVAADKPFLYLVRHTPTGTVLFAGQVTNPGS